MTKIDRAQASAAQISMASFQQERPNSKGLSRKTTPVPAASEGGATANVSNVEVERLRARISEVEKILMAKEITMKNLGDPEEVASPSTTQGKKSAAKFDRDWTGKVEMKLQKLSSTLKSLMNKVGDIINGNTAPRMVQPGRSQSVLSGKTSNSSLKFRNIAAAA